MKSSLLLLLSLSVALASPTPEQHFLGNVEAPLSHLRDSAAEFLDEAKVTILRGKANMQKWLHDGKEYIMQNDLLYELVSHPSFSEYQLLVTEPKLCDPKVKQYSGYLDISRTKHLFFWFFEARNSPENAPVILWQNGGPGCASSGMGLLYELGPCNIANHGFNTTLNPYSWNNNANVIFLDQPVEVGFSYDEDGVTVDTSPAGAKDVYAFLQLFFKRFQKYSTLPFHIAAESYGGVYAPNIANVIYKQNKQLSRDRDTTNKHINLASVILANAESDPKIQQGSVADYVCDGPYAIFDPRGQECVDLRLKIKECQRQIDSCYNYPSRFTCAQASLYCMTHITEPLL
ncbi:hypothetical protein MPER_05281, partial [Moniliophthora perniciosa FA553]